MGIKSRIKGKTMEKIVLSYLDYTVGPCWFSILDTVVCPSQSQTPNK